ncbi:MerR family transcriptional regulator [Enterococcus sp. RIT-PI-f]|uniref:MerR family transcriptional regulator n=1 Tax=Enterococcus sp. RIT-PI-f TaxID=1690244 RepID=UPI0006B9AA2E|nr:MerR family transcriptional regulator [Enterococcus sp. RIT-PI-f]KPG73035.1 transcriptional regulator [Enterococcus sp. RIT-PI-f]
MNIKQVSELTGVSADTIRYYEKIALIPPVKRNKNGVRTFDEEDLKWIKFTRQMRNAGLSIDGLTHYLALFSEGRQTVPERKQLLADQIAVLREKITDMTEAVERLEFKLAHYDEHILPTEERLRQREPVTKLSKTERT